MKTTHPQSRMIVYQTASGAVEVRFDTQQETVLLTQQQVADLFNVQKAAISKHTQSIFSSRELDRQSTVSILETVQTEGARKVKRKIEYYNLDLILSIGYRVNSLNATKFRQWATKTLRDHITKGYTLNKKRIGKNYSEFLKAVDAVKKLLPANSEISARETVELVKLFANTWLSLEAYDKGQLPKIGANKRQISITTQELQNALVDFKADLQKRKLASDLFGQEKEVGSIAGIVGTVFQSVFGTDAYVTIEEKAAHLLYFFVKNHPFVDGNKRSGAFAFVWFLNKARLLNPSQISPEALTALTLLVAESQPQSKDQIIGLLLLMLRK